MRPAGVQKVQADRRPNEARRAQSKRHPDPSVVTPAMCGCLL